ncbi:MFS transporter [Desulfomonile tiedjei]|uniref:Sugar phosphate permease n=1 Tax=Desulfomonile tiedjei (strain ATCC 49306 / DSM 6799 / DCB-1) TaxID=706587 RepID=I4C4X0_DESTA|nr:MFS transporter [Desulfomonile tiedjei]AFM24611.1 sugar phosphate permease [Desulfomonile tiedjei DSM 6799]
MKRTKFDGWLAGFCAARVFNGFVFMTYAAALPLLEKEWGMSALQAGAIASGFQLGYAISQVVFSSIADRVSARTVYLGSLFATGICSLAFALWARDFVSGLILHTMVGVALGGTYTTGVMIIADQYESANRGMAVGFFIAGTSCGYALSLAISGITLPIGGYKLSFFLTCLGPMLAWLVAWITLRHTVVHVRERQSGQNFTREVLRNRRAMLLICGYSFHNWELQGMWSWTPAFMAACMGAAGAVGAKAAGTGANIVALFHVTGLVASFSMGTLSDRFGRARVMLALATVSMMCSFTFGWSLGMPSFVVIGIGVVYALSSIGDSPVLSAALTEVTEPSYLGSALGLRSLVGFGGAAIAPLAFGAILDWSNPLHNGHRLYLTWGWAFSVLGLGGLGAVWAVYRYGKMRESL